MMQSILVVFGWVCLGMLCSKIAKKKCRNTSFWFFLGVFFGLIALIIIYFLKPIKLINKEQSINTPFTLFPDKNYWYYLDKNKKQIGPMSVKVLFDNLLNGKISNDTFVWNDTMQDWKKVNEIDFFSKTLNQLNIK